MPTRRRVALLGALAATLAACAFFSIATGHAVYAPGARALQQKVASTDDFSNPALNSYWFGHIIYTAVRKFYSVVAFAIVGCLAAPALGDRRTRVVRAAIAVALFSLMIEIAQDAGGSKQTLLWSAGDVAYGALGGAIGAYAWNFFTRPKAGS